MARPKADDNLITCTTKRKIGKTARAAGMGVKLADP
jgi:hypothetical protein